MEVDLFKNLVLVSFILMFLSAYCIGLQSGSGLHRHDVFGSVLYLMPGIRNNDQFGSKCGVNLLLIFELLRVIP